MAVESETGEYENQEDGPVDKSGEPGEDSSTFIQPPDIQEATAATASRSSSTSKVERKFRPAWKSVYPWLQYDEEKGMSHTHTHTHNTHGNE